MERLIYTKYSNQRHPDYAIRTDIVCWEDGSRVVRKYADTRLARPHIEHMNEVYALLKKSLQGAVCVQIGQTLQMHISNLNI